MMLSFEKQAQINCNSRYDGKFMAMFTVIIPESVFD